MLSCKPLTHLPLTLLLLSLVFESQAAAEPNVYVANRTDNSVSVVDADTDSVLATIPVGDSPERLAVAPDGSRVYVANTGSNSVSVIDTTTNMVLATVAVANGPSAVAVTPGGGEIYILATGGVLQVLEDALIGSATNPVVATVPLGTSTQIQTAIAILPNGLRAYALAAGALHVLQLDTETLTVQDSVFVGNSPTRLALSLDGSRAYVTNSFGTTESEFGLSGQVVVVDTATNSVTRTIPLPTLPGGIAITPDGTRAFVASVARLAAGGEGIGFLPDDNVAVINLGNDAINWIQVPGTPSGIAVTPDGSLAYVAIPSANSLTVIDTGTETLGDPVGVSAGPRGVAIGTPPGETPSTAPNAPSGLAVSGVTPTSAEIVWVDNSDDETGFEIERSMDEQAWNSLAVVAPDIQSYVDSTVEACTTYFYRVTAIKNELASTTPEPVQADTTGCNPEPPTDEEFAALQQLLGACEEENGSLLAAAGANVEAVAAATAAIEELNASIRELEEQNSALQTSNDALTQENTALQAAVNDLTAQIAVLNDEKAGLQSRVDDLTAEKAALSSENEALNNTIEEQAAEIASLQALNESLQERLKMTKKKWRRSRRGGLASR